MAKKSRAPRWIGLTPKQAAKASREYRKAVKEGKSSRYAKRVARGIAQGKTKQAARGHKPQEHVTRRVNAGLTAEQRLQIAVWYSDEYNPRGYDDVARVTRQEMEDKFTELGMRAFSRTRQKWRDVKNDWIHAGRPIKPGLYRLEDISTWIDELGLGDDPRWLFYH